MRAFDNAVRKEMQIAINHEMESLATFLKDQISTIIPIFTLRVGIFTSITERLENFAKERYSRIRSQSHSSFVNHCSLPEKDEILSKELPLRPGNKKICSAEKRKYKNRQPPVRIREGNNRESKTSVKIDPKDHNEHD